MTRRLRILYLGNFGPPHSTENHVLRAFRSAGHQITAVQENRPANWRRLAERPSGDLLLWTRTGWDWEAVGSTWHEATDLQRTVLDRYREAGIPTVGFHLDRWWGLGREHQVADEPFFRCDLLVTADGGHDAEWEKASVNHAWLPPAVSRPEAQLGRFNRALASEIAFVGNWQGGYHPEWTHRAELVEWLRSTYGDRVRFWPQPGKPAVRGRPLRDLYASVQVLVGDSCLVGGATHYCSDRVSETIGRGGFLIHPEVEGITDGTHYTAWEHLATWPLGDWDALRDAIDGSLAYPDHAKAVATRGRAHVLANHTYEIRAGQILSLARERGRLA